MLAHMKGHEGNVLVRTQIQSLRMRGPLDEAPKNASYWPPFVPLSVCSGGADLAGGFCLRNLSYNRSTTIMGPIWDTIALSRSVVDASCEEFGRRVNMGLLRLVRAHRFASSVIPPQGYKAGGHPCAHLCTLT
jgi:hypothetical protein